MDLDQALERLDQARVARLATLSADGSPHLVPIVFTIVGGAVVHMIDHKPKRSMRLRRLENVRARPRATVLVDHYHEDWSGLWWVRVDGPARVIEAGEEWAAAREALSFKYPQYRDRPPDGPLVTVEMSRVTWWEA